MAEKIAEEEMDWIHAHPEIWIEYAGQWIAVEPNGICASGYDAESVFEQAKGSGVRDPLIFKVPVNRGPHFYGTRTFA